MVPDTTPVGERMIKQPEPAVFICPSVLGRLPTMIHPVFNWIMAVVRPTPPGHPAIVAARWANTATFLLGWTSTMVVPVP
jgi:hypothetical protein